MINAIFKVEPGYNGRKDEMSIYDTMNYIGDHPIQNGVYGLGCSNTCNNASEEFMKTKEIFDKNKGVMCRHYMLSFCENKLITEETIKIIAYYTAKFFWEKGFQVYYGIHTNNSNAGYHIHYCVNSVNIYDGKKIPINQEFKQSFIFYVSSLNLLKEKIWITEANNYV